MIPEAPVRLCRIAWNVFLHEGGSTRRLGEERHRTAPHLSAIEERCLSRRPSSSRENEDRAGGRKIDRSRGSR